MHIGPFQPIVQRVTDENSPDFVAPAERIVVFDNDGTLWVEQSMYTQLAFAIDRIKALAPQHPEWKTKQPFQAVLEGDLEALAAAGEKGLTGRRGCRRHYPRTDFHVSMIL